MQLEYEISNFIKYPITIYPSSIRIISSFIVPFAFASFFPASFFIRDVSILSTILLEVGIAIIAFYISYTVFCIGIKVYNSVGN